MKKTILVALLSIVCIMANQVPGQTERQDAAIFIEDTDEFKQYMEKSADEISKKEEEKIKKLKMDYDKLTEVVKGLYYAVLELVK